MDILNHRGGSDRGSVYDELMSQNTTMTILDYILHDQRKRSHISPIAVLSVNQSPAQSSKWLHPKEGELAPPKVRVTIVREQSGGGGGQGRSRR